MSGGLFYTMGLDPRQFLGALDQTKSAVGGMGSAIGGLTKIVGGLTAAFAGLGVGAVAFEALHDAADFEKLSVGMNTLIKDAKATAGMMQQLAKFSTETPLQLPDIAEGARALLAAGEAASMVTDDLKMLGNVAAVAQAPLQEVVGLYAKARGAGRVGGDLFQSFNALHIDKPIKEAIAEIKHIPVGLIEEMASRGEVSFSDLRRAIQATGQQGGMFFNALKDQSTTTLGLVSTLKDNWNALLRVFASPTNDAIKPMLTAAIEALDTMRGKAEVFVSALGVAAAKNKLGEFIELQIKLGFANAVNFANRQWKGFAAVVASTDVLGGLSSPNLWNGIAALGADSMRRISGSFALAMFDAWDGFIQSMGPAAQKIFGLFKVPDAARAKAAMDANGRIDHLDERNGQLVPVTAQEMAMRQIRDAWGTIAANFGQAVGNAGETFTKAAANAGDVIATGPMKEAANDMMKAGRLQRETSLQGQKKALDAQNQGLQATTQPLLDQFIAKLFGGGGAGGAPGLGGGGAGGAPGAGGGTAGRMNRRLTPLEEATRQFNRLSGAEFNRFNTDQFANNGKGAKRSAEDTFQEFLKSRPDLRSRVEGFGKKFGLGKDQLSLGQGENDLLAKGLVPRLPRAAQPDQRFFQNGNRELSTIEKILRSIDNKTGKVGAR